MFASIWNHSEGYNLQNRYSNLVKDWSTGSPSFTPTCFKPSCFNAPCQFTPLFNLHSIILSLMPFGWLHAHSKLRQLLCACHLVQTMWFICMLSFLFYLQMQWWQTKGKNLTWQWIIAAIILAVIYIWTVGNKVSVW